MIVVDALQHYPAKSGYEQRCFMMNDDKTEKGLEALHAFAKRIGLDRLYFEDTPHFPRYVLTEAMRDYAIADGALPVSGRAMLAMCCWPRRRVPVQVNLEQRGLFDDE